MASARKIDDETEAGRCLRAAKLAGRSAGEWARAHGIDGRSLNAWKVNLARRSATAAPRWIKPKATPPAHALIELVPRDSIGRLAAGGRYGARARG